jgi:hypothetical protein
MRFEDVTCLQETEMAILVDIPELLEHQWVPKSQIDDDSEVYKRGTNGSLVVSDWFAEQQGWT